MDRGRVMGREDDLDDEGYQTREVYAQFGLTIFKAQVLEKGIVNVTTFAEAVATGEREAERFAELYDRLWEANARARLADLLKKFRTLLRSDATLAADLNAAAKERNRLAHTFFWEHAADFMGAGGREAMLTELLLLFERFQRLDERVDAIMRDRLVRDAGWTPERIERVIEGRMREGRERAERR